MASQRPYDILVFGATGFAGKYIVEVLCKSSHGKKWAVGGRSKSRLSAVLTEASTRTGVDCSAVGVLEADVNDYSALSEICSLAKVVINAVGPYRKYGEPVVRACVAASTSYVDICGEPQFLEEMYLRYDEDARRSGSIVVNACGFDSIPADLGMLYAQQVADGELFGAEGFVQIDAGPAGGAGNVATWESAVLGFAHRNELTSLRKRIFTDKSARPSRRMSKRGVVSHSRVVDKWCIPLPSADASVVRRTQYLTRFKNDLPMAELRTYLPCRSKLTAYLGILCAMIFGLLANFSFGRYLLTTFPELFSGGMFKKQGPTREQVLGTKFTLAFDCYVLKDERIENNLVVKFAGPEPGYIATGAMAMEAALTILNERQAISDNGGVFTPGLAFQGTGLLKNLEPHGITVKHEYI